MSSSKENLPARDASFEAVETKRRKIFTAEVLGRLACGAVFENGEKADPDGDLLNGMRAWLHESDMSAIGVKQLREWRQRYPDVFDTMDTIHRVVVSADSGSALSDYAPQVLLANCIRYLDLNNLDTELSSEQLNVLYQEYFADVELCRALKVSNPERIAYHHGRRSLSNLIEKYGDFDFVRGDDFIKAISNYVKSPEKYLERLVQDVAYFQAVSEPALREEYRMKGDPWSSTFIAALSRRFPETEKAARDIFELMSVLRSVYKYASDATVESWARQLVTERTAKKRVEIDQLLAEVPALMLEGGDERWAAEALGRVRGTLRDGEIKVNASSNDSAGVHRLVRVAEANWHKSFDDSDIFTAARSIFFMIKAYNVFVAKDRAQTASAIPVTDANLYSILVAFTTDIHALKREVSPSRASAIARYYGPGICDELHREFPDVSPSVIRSLVANKTKKDVIGSIEQYIERRAALQELLRPERCVGLDAFAYHNDGVERARKYLAFLFQARKQYYWVGRSDVAQFFYDSDDPIVKFSSWAAKVEAIRRHTNPQANRTTGTNFSVHVTKVLAHSDHDVETIVGNHNAKCAAEYAPYTNNDLVTRAMVSLFVIRRKTPGDAIKEYLKRVDDVKGLLVNAGEDHQDDVLVRNLAFSGHDSKKIVARYIAIKQTLEAERENWADEYDNVEQWMITHIASQSSDFGYAKHKLKILSRTIRSKRLSLTETPDRHSHSLERTAQKNYDSTAGLDEVAALVSGLHELDKMAVLAVFGFDEEYTGSKVDVKWLAGELGVADLEAYVMEEVIPYIRTMDA